MAAAAFLIPHMGLDRPFYGLDYDACDWCDHVRRDAVEYGINLPSNSR